MKVVKIAVPDCYGTLEPENKHCLSSSCPAHDYCMSETAERLALENCENESHK